jgi:hypothetical protein
MNAKHTAVILSQAPRGTKQDGDEEKSQLGGVESRREGGA